MYYNSLISVCVAIELDDDTLVYDWITDGRVRIKGTDSHWLFHTSANTHVSYPTEIVDAPADTCWVQTIARDVRGGSNAGVVFFIVRQ